MMIVQNKLKNVLIVEDSDTLQFELNAHLTNISNVTFMNEFNYADLFNNKGWDYIFCDYNLDNWKWNKDESLAICNKFLELDNNVKVILYTSNRHYFEKVDHTLKSFVAKYTGRFTYRIKETELFFEEVKMIIRNDIINFESELRTNYLIRYIDKFPVCFNDNDIVKLFTFDKLICNNYMLTETSKWVIGDNFLTINYENKNINLKHKDCILKIEDDGTNIYHEIELFNELFSVNPDNIEKDDERQYKNNFNIIKGIYSSKLILNYFDSKSLESILESIFSFYHEYGIELFLYLIAKLFHAKVIDKTFLSNYNKLAVKRFLPEVKDLFNGVLEKIIDEQNILISLASYDSLDYPFSIDVDRSDYRQQLIINEKTEFIMIIYNYKIYREAKFFLPM